MLWPDKLSFLCANPAGRRVPAGWENALIAGNGILCRKRARHPPLLGTALGCKEANLSPYQRSRTVPRPVSVQVLPSWIGFWAEAWCLAVWV